MCWLKPIYFNVLGNFKKIHKISFDKLIKCYQLKKLFINKLTISGLFVTSHKAFQEQFTLIYFLRLTLVGGHILYKFQVANFLFACESLLQLQVPLHVQLFQPSFHIMKWSGHGW